MVLAVAVGCVFLRSFIYIVYEQLTFDSDQAIVGLMAKHLLEGRAFPLFFYGQTYMLAVESWVAAPLFLLAGPTVAALRLSLLAWNVAFACLLVLTLRRDNGLGGWLALVPASIFLLMPVSMASQLMNAQGGIVEPFVYVGALWLLRRRPLWFGVVLALGFRNREFVAYAVPSMLVVEALSGELGWDRWRDWLASTVMFVVVWQVVEALKPVADLMGPGTRGQLIQGFSASQIDNLLARFEFDPASLIGRLATLVPEMARWFSGAGQVDSQLPIGDRSWLLLPAAAFVALLVCRVAFLLVGRSKDGPASALWLVLQANVRRANFALYLMAVGVITVAAFLAGRPALATYSRYVLLGLLFPIGLVAAMLALEPRASVRRLAVAAVLVWAVLTAGDHAAMAVAYLRHPPFNSNRVVADQLLADGVVTATAGYWRAYAMTFYARERLRVASADFVRILAYQDEFNERIETAVAISDLPCGGGRRIADVYVCKP